jgi:hypothetical protein
MIDSDNSDLQQALAMYQALGPAKQPLYLACLAAALTMVARDAYVPRPELKDNAHLLKSINEIQHKLLDQLEKVLAGVKARYPDEVLFATLFELAETGLCADQLQFALSEAKRRVNLE